MTLRARSIRQEDARSAEERRASARQRSRRLREEEQANEVLGDRPRRHRVEEEQENLPLSPPATLRELRSESPSTCLPHHEQSDAVESLAGIPRARTPFRNRQPPVPRNGQIRFAQYVPASAGPSASAERTHSKYLYTRVPLLQRSIRLQGLAEHRSSHSRQNQDELPPPPPQQQRIFFVYSGPDGRFERDVRPTGTGVVYIISH